MGNIAVNKTNVEVKDSLNQTAGSTQLTDVQIGGISFNQDERRWRTGENITDAVREKLKNVYRRIELPRLPWMEKNITHTLLIKKYTQLNLESASRVISLEEIFDAVDQNIPTRILIESQPGFGKTTLALKITWDWVKGETKYIEHFKIVILIILKELKSSTLKDEILETIKIENHDAKEVWKLINNNKTLLILDGLDEISEKVRRNIMRVLYDNSNEYRMVMAATCRIGIEFSQRNSQELRSEARGVPMGRNFWHKKVTILGIASENRENFLLNFISDGKMDTILPRLLRIIDFAGEMFKSPLMLILLVYVTRDKSEKKIKTNTDLYKQFVDYIIRRNIAKTNPEKANIRFTLFDSTVHEYSTFENMFGCGLNWCFNFNRFDSSVYSSKFYKFAELCWKHILNDELRFKSNTDTEAIHQMGFLLKRETDEELGDVDIHYEGLHSSILEFAASVFLKEEFVRSNQNMLCDHIIENIINICVQKESPAMTLPFLCGLLENDVVIFFAQLSRYHVRYQITEELMEYILKECVINNSISECVKQIIPPYFSVRKPCAVLALANNNPEHVFDTLNINVSCLVTLINPIHVRVLYCDVPDNNIPHSDVVGAGENINCTFLIFVLRDDLSYETLNTSLQIFLKISSDHKTLRINNLNENSYLHLLNCVCNGVLKNSKFDIIAEINNNGIEKDAIAKIIEWNEVANLTIAVYKSDVIFTSDVYRLITANNGLNSICIFYLQSRVPLCLDWDEIMERGGKNFEYLFFYGVDVQCKPQENKYISVKSLSINAGDNLCPLVNDANVMLSVNPSKLQCKYRALAVLSNQPNALSWGGWDSVIELTLTVNEWNREGYQSSFSNLSTFKKMKILTLELVDVCLKYQIVHDVLRSIRSLQLEKLEIRWFNENYYNQIIHGVQNLIEKGELICTEAIRFVNVWYETKPQFAFKTVKSALQSDCKISFCYLFYGWNTSQMFVKSYSTDLLDFNIEYVFNINDMKNNVANSYQRHSFDLYQDYHMLELTLRS